MVSEWYRNGIRMVPECYQNGTGMVSEWYRNGIRMVPEWYQNGTGMVSEWYRNGIRMVPEWYQNGTGMVSEWSFKPQSIYERLNCSFKLQHLFRERLLERADMFRKIKYIYKADEVIYLLIRGDGSLKEDKSHLPHPHSSHHRITAPATPSFAATVSI